MRAPNQYLAAAEAYLRGIERRIEANLNPVVGSVASLFISRWDVAVAGKVPPALTNMLGIAIGQQAHHAYSQLLESSRWRRAFNAGARPQRLLFASTGTKDPKAPIRGKPGSSRRRCCCSAPTAATGAVVGRAASGFYPRYVNCGGERAREMSRPQ